MRNGNKELEIEVTGVYTSTEKEFSGIVKINGRYFHGDFGMVETYTFDDVEYQIDWSEFI